jgi:YD repeat-containing protein
MNYFAFTANHAKQERDDLLERIHATNEALAGPSTLVRLTYGSESRPMSVCDVFEGGVLEISHCNTGEVVQRFKAGDWIECIAYDQYGEMTSVTRPGQPTQTFS